MGILILNEDVSTSNIKTFAKIFDIFSIAIEYEINMAKLSILFNWIIQRDQEMIEKFLLYEEKHLSNDISYSIFFSS